MLLNLFRVVSLPFFMTFDFLYRLIFQVRPVGEGVFAVEKRPHKYSGPPQKFPNGIEIRQGDKVLGLHLRNDKLDELFSKRFTSKEKIQETIAASLKELARFSLQNERTFAAFCGKTAMRFFISAGNYGFSVTPLGGKRSSLEASLQFLYLRKTRRTFPKRRFYQYMIPREILEEKYGKEKLIF